MSALPQTVSPTLSFSRLSVLMLVLVAGAIVGALGTTHGWQWLHWICKPLATALMLAIVWRSARPVSTRYRRLVLVGMALCLVGDVLLMLPQDLFVPALLSFMFGHASFIVAFSSDARFGVRVWPWLLCLTYGGLAVWMIWSSLAMTLRPPVLLYVGVLATMAGQAWGRAAWLREQNDSRAGSAKVAAMGALLFMLSDSFLAWDRFRAAIPWAPLLILSTYYAALWLIARSVERVAVNALPERA